jgi:hypothetical protein
MTARLWIAVSALLAIGSLAPASGPSALRAWVSALASAPAALEASTSPAGAQAPSSDASTVDDRTDLSLTIYNSDLALVRDVRTLRVPRGVSTLRFMDIAATVNPATVHFRSITDASRLGVLEQNYEYDLLEPEKLLRKYVGRDVTLVRTKLDSGRMVEEAVTAHLLSYNTQPVWRINGEIVTGYHADHIRFPELPQNLFSRPTLIWALDNQGSTTHRVEASYLASRLSWAADYVLTVTRDDRLGDLNGWVTLNNQSGTAFGNASIQLVAGDLNRVRQVMARLEADNRVQAAPASRPMAEESFSDYHLYSLDRKTTINNNQTKQVSLLGASEVPLVKRYVVDGQAFYYRNVQHPGAPLKDDVQVFYQLDNAAASGLGVALPAGTVRVYQTDSRGALQFVGEDHVDHTPKDERVNLKIGNAFDVVAERKQTAFERISNTVVELEYEVTLRNHKEQAITVEVNEPIGGSWRMLSSTHEARRTDAWAAQFMLPVPKDGAATLRYRVRVTY